MVNRKKLRRIKRKNSLFNNCLSVVKKKRNFYLDIKFRKLFANFIIFDN